MVAKLYATKQLMSHLKKKKIEEEIIKKKMPEKAQQPVGCSKSSPKREVYVNTIPQETRKIST